MTCQDFELQIALLTEGDLSASEAERVELHLARCPQCRRFAEEIAESQTALKTYGPLEPHPNELVALRSAVMTRIPIHEKSRRFRLFSWTFVWRFAAAVAIVAAGTLAWRTPDRAVPQEKVSNVRLTPPPSASDIIPSGPQSNPSYSVSRNDASGGRAYRASSRLAGIRHLRQTSRRHIVNQVVSKPSSFSVQKKMRIEIQTADPNIRIIWLSNAQESPSVSSAPSHKG
jgi:hypothetical protein